MNAAFYALDQGNPTLTVGHVSFFEVWSEMRAELASYYGEKAESFRTIEASWNDDNEYAEVVTLKGRIVGALDRPLTQADVAAIWGVDHMETRAFINRIRSLYNIDGDLLPELTREQQSSFLSDPVRFFLDADETQSHAIMREVEARQIQAARRVEPAQKTVETPRASEKTILAKPVRKKKPKSRVEGQRELLLPIAGGAGEGAARVRAAPSPTTSEATSEPAKAPERRKAG